MTLASPEMIRKWTKAGARGSNTFNDYSKDKVRGEPDEVFPGEPLDREARAGLKPERTTCRERRPAVDAAPTALNTGAAHQESSVLTWPPATRERAMPCPAIAGAPTPPHDDAEALCRRAPRRRGLHRDRLRGAAQGGRLPVRHRLCENRTFPARIIMADVRYTLLFPLVLQALLQNPLTGRCDLCKGRAIAVGSAAPLGSGREFERRRGITAGNVGWPKGGEGPLPGPSTAPTGRCGPTASPSGASPGCPGEGGALPRHRHGGLIPSAPG